MKLNYPIKYSAMPIIEQVGWVHGLNELKSEYGIVCYIVSKCFLLGDKIRYFENGKNEKEYEVVFPYQLEKYDKYERCIPKFNYDNECTNSNIVKFVFDSFEEALGYTNKLNDKLSKNYLQTFDNLKNNNFSDKLEYYKILENEIELSTKDLIIGYKNKKNSVIEFMDGKYRLLDETIYDILNHFYSSDIIAFTISERQYDELVNLLNQNNNVKYNFANEKVLFYCLDKKNNCFDKKYRFIDNYSAYYLDRYGILCQDDNLNVVTQDMLENINDKSYILYTTEKIDDLINSYKLNKPYINLGNIERAKKLEKKYK